MADVQVTFGANIADLVAGVEKVKGSIDSLASGFADLGKTIVGAFALDKIAGFIAQYSEMGEQIERTSAMLGVSTKSAQELGFIAKATGGDADGMAKAVERLQLNLQRAQNSTSQQALALKALGLSAKELIGLSIDQQMNRIADAVAKFADGGNKTAIVMALLGRSGAQMIPILDEGSAGLKEMRDAADNVGAVMSKETVTALASLNRATVTLGAALRGLAGTLLGELAPALARATSGTTSLIGEINVAIQTHTVWEREMIGLSTAARELGQALLNMGVIAKDVFTLNWGAIAADRQAGFDKVAAIQKEGEDKVNAIAKQAKAQLQDILAGPETANKPQAPALAVPDTAALKAAMEQYQGMIKAADDAYKLTSDHLAAQLKLHEVTQTQETAQLLAALDQRHAAEDAAIDGELSLYARGTAGYNKALNERKALYDKYILDRQKVTEKAAEAEAAQWKAAADQIAGAINGQLQKILSGHESLRQGLFNISGQIALKFIQDQVKVTIEWLANQARILAGHIATETGMTAATTAGASLRTAAEVAGGQTSILAGIGNALKSIFASAGQTSAEVAANVAPVAGPAAPAIGAAAGAAVIATATGLASFDVGTDYVVRGGLALIHSGEKITPAARGSGPFTGRGGDNLTPRMLSAHENAMQEMLSSHQRSNARLASQMDDMGRAIKKLARSR